METISTGSLETFSYHLAYELINERLSEQALTPTNIIKLATCIQRIEMDPPS